MSALPNIPGAAPPADPDALLDFRNGCALLGIGRRLGWSLVNRGELPHVRIGRLIRFRRAALLAWVQEREAASVRRKGGGA